MSGSKSFTLVYIVDFYIPFFTIAKISKYDMTFVKKLKFLVIYENIIF